MDIVEFSRRRFDAPWHQPNHSTYTTSVEVRVSPLSDLATAFVNAFSLKIINKLSENLRDLRLTFRDNRSWGRISYPNIF
jgi:hypothetical protein